MNKLLLLMMECTVCVIQVEKLRLAMTIRLEKVATGAILSPQATCTTSDYRL